MHNELAAFSELSDHLIADAVSATGPRALHLVERPLSGMLNPVLPTQDASIAALAEYVADASLDMIVDLSTGAILAWSIRTDWNRHLFGLMLNEAIHTIGAKDGVVLRAEKDRPDMASVIAEGRIPLSFIEPYDAMDILGATAVSMEMFRKVASLTVYSVEESTLPDIDDRWASWAYLEEVVQRIVKWRHFPPTDMSVFPSELEFIGSVFGRRAP